MRHVFNILLNFLFPPRKSEALVQTLTIEQLNQLLYKSTLGERILPYQHASVRALVWELKYYKNPRAILLTSTVLSETLLNIASELLVRPLLIPLPMHIRRRKQRGHNQTELLCRATSEMLKGSVLYTPKAMSRTRETVPQQSLSKYKRLYNVCDSMKADSSVVLGHVCIVVDDVMTTGATLKEAKRALLEAGAAKVISLAFAS